MLQGNPLLTLQALARRVRVPATWLRQECAAGRLPHLRAGRQFLFNATAVELALAARAAELPRPEVGDARLETVRHGELDVRLDDTSGDAA